MVRIPLIRHRQKPESFNDEDGNGKVGKGKDSKAKDAPRLGKDQPSQSTSARDGKKTSSPASSSDNIGQAQPRPWGGKGKKIPFPLKSPAEDESAPPPEEPVVENASVSLTLPDKQTGQQPPAAAFVAKVHVPESRPEVSGSVATQTQSDVQINWPPIPVQPRRQANEASEPDSVSTATPDASEPVPAQTESTLQAGPVAQPVEPPSPTKDVGTRAGAAGNLDSKQDQQQQDALAILKAMPDFVFRIGPNGVVPVARDGSMDGTDGMAGKTGIGQSSDSKPAADQADKSKLLQKIIAEELARQSEPHARKALDTKELQTFEFQTRSDKESYCLEARLIAFGQSEVLAVVRDVTLMRQTQNALVESRNELENHLKERNAELIRVNKMLKTEVELREEQDGVLKKNFRKLESLLEDTIGTITLIVEKKDPHVADHQRRVSHLACAIGQEMKLRSDEMRAIRMAAQLHDLGKIFIPAEILRKPSKLTDAEMAVIKTHPDTDYEILKRISFPISIADIVRQHHERLDGSGYPQGLKGDTILVQARILAVADVIEGMVFERPYRVAPGLEVALKEIADHKGTLYDQAVAEACLKLFAEGRFKFESCSGQDTAGSDRSRHEPSAASAQSWDIRDV
jgi:putative nucleotidyltransferase with HDIG domain